MLYLKCQSAGGFEKYNQIGSGRHLSQGQPDSEGLNMAEKSHPYWALPCGAELPVCLSVCLVQPEWSLPF